MFSYEIIQSLNSLELSLYEYIMTNSKKVIYMRIRELADEAHVSTTTILRFCKKLNCEGFSEFKVKFKMYIEENNTKKVSDDISETINFLKNIEESDLDKRLDKLCDLVRSANTIVFIGIGSSGILCKYAARYFSAIGKFSFHIDDPFFPKNFKAYGESLVIALSVSGETQTTIENVMRFKEEGYSVASITNSENCTIAKISDLNVPYYVQPVKVNYSDITTQLPVLYMIERIGNKLYNQYIIE